MASGSSNRDAKSALSKLLQMGTVAEYESMFVILANRVTRISANLLKSFYISGLKLALQCALLSLNPTTLDESFSLARATEARFTNLQLLELLRSNPTTLGEAFFRALVTEARFKDENNQAVDHNVGDQEDPNVNDKQEVKKADDQETANTNKFLMIRNVKDDEGKNVVDQQVSEQTINETTDTIASLQSEVASLEAKGSLDTNEEIKETHTRVHELEKLQMELQLKKNFREALETTSKDLEKKMIDLNPTLHDLQKVKTKCALKIDDEEFKKAKSEATTKIRKLAKVYGAWLPP
ncbi:hypothetical protein Tco_0930913 [Tanacetum coccineum]